MCIYICVYIYVCAFSLDFENVEALRFLHENTVLESTISNTDLSEFFALTEFQGESSVSSKEKFRAPKPRGPRRTKNTTGKLCQRRGVATANQCAIVNLLSVVNSRQRSIFGATSSFGKVKSLRFLWDFFSDFLAIFLRFLQQNF